MAPKRKAFTLLELLVVIAIMAVLMTLLTLGVRSINRSSREKSTRTRMGNLKSLVTEREIHGGMSAIYALYNSTAAIPYGPALPVAVPGKASPVLPIPGLVTADAPPGQRLPSFTGTPPEPQNEVARTQMVMNLLRAVPLNAKMIAQLPAETFMPAPTGDPITAPVPLDGWGNPMLYVPGGGIPVFVSGRAGAFLKTAPDGKGFWVSAGPDGAFGGYFEKNGNTTYDDGIDTPYGDDNVYSFEN